LFSLDGNLKEVQEMKQTDERNLDADITRDQKSQTETRQGFAGFVTRWRTKLSQILGVVFILALVFSEKRLEYAAPFSICVMFAVGCALVGIATVGRLWCAQYIAGYKTETLVTSGPYSLCRNPLYFFSLLGGLGVGLCTGSVTLTLVIATVFALIYSVTIGKEERNLRNIFGGEYDKYAARVPRFIPKPSLFAEPDEYAVKPRLFRREAVDAMYFVWIVGLLELLGSLVKLGIVPAYFSIY